MRVSYVGEPTVGDGGGMWKYLLRSSLSSQGFWNNMIHRYFKLLFQHHLAINARSQLLV
jgi:hypothetical protein